MADPVDRGLNFRDKIAEVASVADDLAHDNAMLTIRCESLERANALLAETSERQRIELERAVAHNKSLAHENQKLVRIITGAGNMIRDGVAEIFASRGKVTQLRGAPMPRQETEEPMPSIVRMGPRAADGAA